MAKRATITQAWENVGMVTSTFWLDHDMKQIVEANASRESCARAAVEEPRNRNCPVARPLFELVQTVGVDMYIYI